MLRTEDAKNIIALIPAWNEERFIGDVVRGALKYVPVVVIDDGSTDRTAQVAEEAGAEVVRHKVNSGKGVALNTGFDHAVARGVDAAITLDADGQHDPDEIPLFIEAFRGRERPHHRQARFLTDAGEEPIRQSCGHEVAHAGDGSTGSRQSERLSSVEPGCHAQVSPHESALRGRGGNPLARRSWMVSASGGFPSRRSTTIRSVTFARFRTACCFSAW